MRRQNPLVSIFVWLHMLCDTQEFYVKQTWHHSLYELHVGDLSVMIYL